MDLVIAFILGGVVIGVCAVIYYRRNTKAIEAALIEAVKIRDGLEKTILDLKKKLGQ